MIRLELNLLGIRGARMNDMLTVLKLLGAGRINTRIAARFPLAKVGEAHETLVEFARPRRPDRAAAVGQLGRVLANSAKCPLRPKKRPNCWGPRSDAKCQKRKVLVPLWHGGSHGHSCSSHTNNFITEYITQRLCEINSIDHLFLAEEIHTDVIQLPYEIDVERGK